MHETVQKKHKQREQSIFFIPKSNDNIPKFPDLCNHFRPLLPLFTIFSKIQQLHLINHTYISIFLLFYFLSSTVEVPAISAITLFGTSA